MAKGVVRTDAPIDDKAKKVRAHRERDDRGRRAARRARLPAPDAARRLQPAALRRQLAAGNAEQEPNEAGAAQGVTLPAALVGTLATAGDVDAYSSAPARARRWSSRWSRARSARASTASSGCSTRRASVLAENNDVDLSRDSVLTWRFAEAGSYIVDDRGRRARGRRRTASPTGSTPAPCPIVTGVFPLGVRRAGARRHRDGCEPWRSRRNAARARAIRRARRPD